MTVTLHAVQNLPSYAGERRVVLTRDAVAQLVNAISDSDCNLRLIDDRQCGYIADGVNPDALAIAAASLDPASRESIAPLLAFALINRFELQLDSGDDRPSREAMLKLTDTRVGEVQVQWTASHAWSALGALGFAVEADAVGYNVAAKELAAALKVYGQALTPRDCWALTDLARYALTRVGPEAEIVAA